MDLGSACRRSARPRRTRRRGPDGPGGPGRPGGGRKDHGRPVGARKGHGRPGGGRERPRRPRRTREAEREGLGAPTGRRAPIHSRSSACPRARGGEIPRLRSAPAHGLGLAPARPLALAPGSDRGTVLSIDLASAAAILAGAPHATQGGRVLANNTLEDIFRKPFLPRNGKLWKALPRVRCAKTRFDCALMAREGAFLKDNGFDFTEAVDRRRGKRGNSRASLRQVIKPRTGGPGRPERRLHEEACIGTERSAGPPSRDAEGRPARRADRGG